MNRVQVYTVKVLSELSGILMSVYCAQPVVLVVSWSMVERIMFMLKENTGALKRVKQQHYCLSASSHASSALFAPRMFSARPGQKSPTALHDDSSSDKDKDDGINYTTVDWREFMCNTWHLEPTLRSTVLQSVFVCLFFCYCFIVVFIKSHAHSKPPEEEINYYF